MSGMSGQNKTVASDAADGRARVASSTLLSPLSLMFDVTSILPELGKQFSICS